MRLWGKLKQLFWYYKNNPKKLIPIVAVVVFLVTLVKIYAYLTAVFFVRPEVIWSYPMPGDKEFSLDSNIMISFSRKMNKKKVERSLKVTPEIEGDLSWEGNSLVFNPKEDLVRDQEIIIEVGRGASALNWRRLKSAVRIDFTTLSHPHVAMASPTGSITEEVKNIVIMFNKSIKRPEGEILEVVPEIEGESKWVGSSAYMIKTKDLIKGERYTARLTQDLGSLDGGSMTKGYEFEFVNFAPAILHMDADSVSGEKALEANPKGPVTVYFNQGVDRQSVIDRLSFSKQLDSSEVPYRVEFLNRSKADDKSYYRNDWERHWQQKVVIFPTVTMEPMGSYVLRLDAGFGSEQGSATAEFGQNYSFVTADLPGYLHSRISDGETEVRKEERVVFSFKSPMDSVEMKSKVVIKKNGTVTNDDYFITASTRTKKVSFYRYLDRSTFFEVYIPASTRDAYGRPLGEDVRLSFTTAPHAPSIGIQPGREYFVTFADNVNTRFVSRVVNVPNMEYNIYSMDENKFMDLYETSKGEWGKFNFERLLDAGFEHVKSWTYYLDLEKDIYTDVLMDVNRDMELDLKPGFYLMDVSFTEGDGDIIHDNIAFIVGDVSVVQKITKDQVMVWASGLSEREVKEGYNVRTYEVRSPNTAGRSFSSVLTKMRPTNRKPVLEGKTDKDGVLLRNFETNKEYYTTYLTVVEKEGDLGIVVDEWNDGISSFSFGNVKSSRSIYSDGSDEYKAFALTDRRLYRPGQTLKYTAFIRNNGFYDYTKVNGRGVITVSIKEQTYYYGRNESANVLHSETFELQDQDMYSGEFVLPEGLELGRYVLVVKLDDKILYNYSFDVQEYVRPDFEVVANVPGEQVSRGDQIGISAEAKYFYGVPLVGNETDYRLYKRNYIFRSDEYPNYSFYSRKRYYGEDSYWSGFEEEKVLDASGRTNSEGKVTLSPSTRTQDGVSEIYTFEVDVLGENNRKFTGSGEYVVHMAEHYTGIRSGSYLGKAGEKSTFEIIAIDSEDKELEDKKINVSVHLRKYYRTKKKDNSEGYLYEVTHEDELIETDEVKTDEAGKAVYEFEPENAGTHVVEVQSFDSNGNRSVADINHYVSSNESGYWKRENHDRIDLVTDKDEYEPGDDVYIAPISTLEKAIGLLTIEAEGIVEYDVFRQDSSSEVQKFKAKDSHMPNVYASITLVSPGDSVFNPAEFKIGIKNINVDSSKNKLNVEISTNKDSYLPKEDGEAVIKVEDKDGNRVSDATVTLALVDDSLMSIASLNRSNAFDHFYSPRYFSVMNSNSLTQSLDRINLNTEIGAKGGSGSKGGAGGGYLDLTRSNFAETALWLPSAKTDSNGETKANFKLPDSITRWNLFVLVQDNSGSKFGQNVHKFGSSRDVFGAPALPRFLRNGDISKIGVVVHNNTDNSKDLEVGIQVEGLAINGESYKSVSVDKKSSKKLTFSTTALDVEEATVTFTVKEDGEVKDLVVRTLPVLPYGLEMVQSFTNSVKNTAFEEVELAPEANKDYGELDVRVQGSMLGVAEEVLEKLGHGDYLSVRNVSSRSVPLAYEYKFALSQEDQEWAEEIEKPVLNSTSLIVSAQRGDGGWGYWNQAKESNIYDTAFAMELLGEAAEVGISLNPDSIRKGVQYLEKNLNESGVGSGKISTFVLYILELNKSDQTGRIGEMYKRKASLSDVEKAQLIMAMEENKGGWSKQISQLKSELAMKADLGSGRIFWSESGYGKSFCMICNDFSATAIVLRAFNQSDADGPIANLAIRHLTQLKDRGWDYVSMPQRGKATAILENIIMRGIKIRDSEVDVLVNDQVKVSGQMEGKDPNSSVSMTIPVSELQEGSNKVGIRLAKGGNAFYSMTLTTLIPFDVVDETSNGIGLVRELYDTRGNKIINNRFKVGESYIVRLTVATPNIRRNVVLEDFLPGGFESVNETLKNESAQTVETARTPSEGGRTYYYIDSQQMKDSSTQLQMSYIPQGLFEYSYVVKATVAGEYKYRPAHIFEQNSPDIRANTEGFYIVVEE